MHVGGVLPRSTQLPWVRLRRTARILSLLLIAAGILLGAWVLVVWQWKDPFTSIYTWYEQRGLASSYDHRVHAYRASHPGAVATKSRLPRADVLQLLAREAKAYRLASHSGQAIGRLQVPRLGLSIVLVNGTDHDSLTKGPGRDLRTFMPGEGKLVYIAGHRTTYLAPFAHIDSLRQGDPVTLSVPYGTFHYRVTGHRIVPADDLSQLRSRGYEQLALQACHPRFFATNRYIAYAKPVSVELPSGSMYKLWG